MTSIQVEKPIDGVIHLVFPAQLTLAKAFMRLQEFYESPIGDFRGRYFTRDEFKKAYAERCGTGTGWGEFTYYKDWEGFNVPGNVVDKFIKTFDIDFMEENMIGLIQQHRPKTGRYYVIGTFKSGVPAVVDHELSHAMWYLDPDNYRIDAELIASQLSNNFLRQLHKTLRAMGYCPEVYTDEVVAYLSTSPMWEIVDIFGTESIPWRIVLRLQQNFQSYLGEAQDEE